MRVEVVYAVTGRFWSATLECAESTSVKTAICLARQQESFREAPIESIQHVSIWGETVELDHSLQDGDRIEILRKLTMDPMELRRLRASTEAN